jgi:hypothetical protein
MRTLRTIAIGLGLTTILLAWLVEPLVKSTHYAVYHWSGRADALFFPIAVDIVVVWAILALLLLTAGQPGRWQAMVWTGLLLLSPWILLRNVTMLWPEMAPHWVRLPPVWVALILWLLLVAVWRPAASGPYGHVIEFASTVLSFVAISGAFFLMEFSWSWWQARALNAPRALHQETVAATATSRPRIIWIVLDELSHQQVYAQRYAGLQLPAFDALAKQATVFTEVEPAANYTEIALPSLMDGKDIDDVRSSAAGQLSIHAAGAWRRFDARDTVFQDALNAGYSTSVVGWYNPYCRILPAVLDRCYWRDDFTQADGLSADEGVERNVLASGDVLIGNGSMHHLLRWFLPLADARGRVTELHIEDYRELSGAADRVLSDRGAQFVFLHLPIPHPAGIYNRVTRRLTTGPSTYIDNLALADRYLAHVRRVLEKSGQWDSSTVMVMGDHGWRTKMLWETEPGWTAEDERASLGGGFDERPAYIVKLAGQETGAQVSVRFHAQETRAMVDELLDGKIRSEGDLVRWAQENADSPRHGQYVASAP